jgi:hypothetical protein
MEYTAQNKYFSTFVELAIIIILKRDFPEAMSCLFPCTDRPPPLL